MIRKPVIAASAAVLLSVGLWSATSSPASAARPFARAELRSASGIGVGSVSFTNARRSTKTVIVVRLKSFSGGHIDSFHGFHVHANDVATNGDGCVADPAQPASTWFVSADGHWKNDPADVHGNHAGDLPSVYINSDGTAEMRMVVSKLTADQVVNRVVILHGGPDNFGNVPVGAGADQYTANSAAAVTKTQGTGNAGDRIACGVVGRK